MGTAKLIAKTDFIGVMDDERLADYAAGVCYRSLMRQNKDRIANCIRRGHESVIEHLSATFLIEEISRACSHQIVRHRLASYSQQSQRYCDSGEWEPVIPESIENDEVVKPLYLKLMHDIKKFYISARAYGIPKEDARFALPNATPTTMVMTANLREWRHFIKMRATKHAQWEIRSIAKQVLKSLYTEYPVIFSDLYREFIEEEE